MDFTSSSPTVLKDKEVILSCTYDLPTEGAAPVVTWYKDGREFTSESITSPDTLIQNKYTIAKSDETNNGVYKCEVDYGSLGIFIFSSCHYYRFIEY